MVKSYIDITLNILTQSVMFDTYYEIEHKKMNEDGFTDYKNMSGVSCIYSVCECEGRIKDKAFPCVRNPETVFRRDTTVCLWFLSNGSLHCGHRWESTQNKEEQ